MSNYNFMEAQMSPKTYHEHKTGAKPMTQTHTPAPWNINPKRYPAGNFAIMARPQGGNKTDIAAVYHPEWGYDAPVDANEAQANARLIAAAPDLLAALIVAVQVMKDQNLDEALSGEFCLFEDAIAHARGESGGV